MVHTKDRGKVWAVVILLIVALAVLVAPRPAVASVNEVCLPQAKYCIPYRLGEYWQENGGLAIFGLPISPYILETDPDTGRTTMFQ